MWLVWRLIYFINDYLTRNRFKCTTIKEYKVRKERCASPWSTFQFKPSIKYHKHGRMWYIWFKDSKYVESTDFLQDGRNKIFVIRNPDTQEIIGLKIYDEELRCKPLKLENSIIREKALEKTGMCLYNRVREKTQRKQIEESNV